VPFLEFRKMRFDRHLAISLAPSAFDPVRANPVRIMRCYTNVTNNQDTPFAAPRKSPLCTVSRRACWIFNKT
jgi:hypothetical protein